MRLKNILKSVLLLYSFFDILYLEGNSLLKEPYPKRRALLEEHVKESEILHLAEELLRIVLKRLRIFSTRLWKRSLKEL